MRSLLNQSRILIIKTNFKMSTDLENKDLNSNDVKPVLGEVKTKHYLQYSIYSTKVSWCPICNKHFYNDRNDYHTTKATIEHYHEI